MQNNLCITSKNFVDHQIFFVKRPRVSQKNWYHLHITKKCVSPAYHQKMCITCARSCDAHFPNVCSRGATERSSTPLPPAPAQQEMLLLPGTVFKVVHCGCDKFSLFSHAVRFIQLVELHDEPCSVAPASPFGSALPLSSCGRNLGVQFACLPSWGRKGDLVDPKCQ